MTEKRNGGRRFLQPRSARGHGAQIQKFPELKGSPQRVQDKQARGCRTGLRGDAGDQQLPQRWQNEHPQEDPAAASKRLSLSGFTSGDPS